MGAGSLLTSVVGISHRRASGLLLKQVQDSVSKASFLKLCPPVAAGSWLPFVPLNTWAAWLGDTQGP